jgi:hypothetical protein
MVIQRRLDHDQLRPWIDEGILSELSNQRELAPTA